MNRIRNGDNFTGSMINEIAKIDSDDGSMLSSIGLKGKLRNDVLHGSSDSISIDKYESDNTNNQSKQQKNSPSSAVARPTNDSNIASGETIAVNRLKILVLVALLVPTTLVAGAVFYYTRNAEQEEFEEQFFDDGRKVIDGLGKSFNSLIESTESLSVSFVSYAYNANMTWPFVTLPNFYTRTSIIRSLADTVWTVFYPIVEEHERYEWEEYSAKNNYWVDESIRIQEKDRNYEGPIVYEYEKWDVIWDNSEYYKEDHTEGTNRTGGNFMPVWQNSPMIPYYAPYNWDLASITSTDFLDESIGKNRVTISYPYLGGIYEDPNDEYEIEEMSYELDWIKDYISPDEEPDEPASDLTYPIITNLDGSNIDDGNYTKSGGIKVVGTLSITYYWRAMLRGILPPGSIGIIVVVDSCLSSFTYRIDGSETTYLGAGDLHNEKYELLKISAKLTELSNVSYTAVPINEDYCPFYIRVYPSDDFRDSYASNEPVIFTIITVLIFAILHTFVFLIYDVFVQRRNKLVSDEAHRSRAFVNSLFPTNVAVQLLGENEESEHTRKGNGENVFSFTTSKRMLTSFLVNDDESARLSNESHRTKHPIAEVFTDTTVMISDICGFSAWASVREPTQVFALLENIYGAFDEIVDRRKDGDVFKVETIGDSYVAVSGLPERRKNHAVIIAKFASDCRNAFIRITGDLEVTLGPETSDLTMRFGLASGSLTAGVLRGKNARFQIFGSTVNMASRMESTGKGNMIHASKKTADLLVDAGKEHWLTNRKEIINVKSFGKMQTYFVQPQRVSKMSLMTSKSTHDKPTGENMSTETHGSEEFNIFPVKHLTTPKMKNDAKNERLVNWMVDLFSNLLKNIIIHRPLHMQEARKSYVVLDSDGMVRDEVVEIISLPEFNATNGRSNDLEDIDLGVHVISQLRRYITEISLMYNQNKFHNFEHACQVTMATKKILSRVVSPDDIEIEEKKDLHDSTYGITSDPLTQFAVVYSALIHDVDHPGVPNDQLVREKTAEAIRYSYLSVSEQHSIDVAWNLLMDEESYPHLRSCIFSNPTELKRFRQLVVNAVMATDIFDKQLKSIRDARWEKAFDTVEENLNTELTILPADNPDKKEPSKEIITADAAHENNRIFSNRRATIVIEHVIQASDIAHCMQHWKVYQKWNKRLFEEMHDAYVSGRSTKDPADSWYNGELWFFDNYIIPLAKKLKECGVFGVSCDEFLDYAHDNRQEWAIKGKEIVLDMEREVRWKDVQKEREEITKESQKIVQTLIPAKEFNNSETTTEVSSCMSEGGFEDETRTIRPSLTN